MFILDLFLIVRIFKLLLYLFFLWDVTSLAAIEHFMDVDPQNCTLGF